MAEPKNPFDFGTGSIDKDQWLRDIDNEQDAFISRYSGAVNKHRATLLRDAFADLRRRIANGDMLNRTADGQYQFGSALNREDKHMEEAYRRALGFMGDLARKQIQAPPPEPEKKKYSTKTLNDRFVRYFNPSGSQESFTSLWNSYDNATRLNNIKKFLQDELTTGLNNYQDVEDYESLDKLKTAIKDFIADPNITNLNRLGFTKNYLSQLKTEEQQEEEPKSELEQVQADIAAAQEAQQAQQGRQYLNWQKYKGNPQKWEFETKPYDYQGMFDYNRRNGNIKTSYQFQTPDFRKFSFTPFQDKSIQDANKLRESFDKQNTELITNYLKDLGVNYSTMAGQARLGAMLGMLQSSFNIGDKIATPYASQMSKYFTPMQNGAYYINGSANKETGRYAFYTPKQIGTYAPGIHEVSILDLDDPAIRQALGMVQSNKQGGVIEKFDGGGEISDQDWANYLNKVEPKTTKPSTQTETVPQDTNEKMDFGDIANIAGPLALDITSMFTANGIGVGTAISAGTGVASTLWQGINDWDNNNVWGSLGSIGANLVSDGIGLIPGLGIAGKVGKIAKGLAKHAKYLGLAFNAIGATDAAQVLYKGVKNGFDLSPDEWKTLGYGLAGVAQGSAGVKRANRTNLKRGSVTQKVYSASDKRGIESPVAVGIDAATPGRTGRVRYIANKEDILKTRGETLTPDWTSSMNNSFKKIMSKPRSSVILDPWETMENPLHNPFSLTKARNKYNQFTEQWNNRKKGKTANQSNKDTNTENNTSRKDNTEKEKLGGILKALRNGGIIKAQEGLKTDGLTNKYDNISDWTKLNFGVTEKQYFPGFMKARYDNRGNVLYPHSSFAEQEEGEHFGDQSTLSAYDAQQAYYLKDNGSHIFGDVQNAYNTWKSKNSGTVQDFINYYNGKVDQLRSWGQKKLQSKANSGGWKKYNQTFNELYSNYSPYDPKLEDIIGESTWQRTPNTFKGITDLAELRQGVLGIGEGATQVAIDNQGHLITDNLINPKGDIKETKKENGKEQASVADSERGDKTILNTNFENPIDPTPFIVAGKTMAGLMGNKNIYGNLIDEMPQAPLRDPINRQSAIVGWQERIKSGQNQLADLRRIQQMQQGSDQQTNFATALETDRTGRDIMDKAFQEDSGRQFETAQKLWNLKNEDIMYNTQVSDANRRAIADRARMIAQIRAAWRSGNNNILMGALSDTGNWLLKKYQREQDIVDKSRELALGTPEEWAQSEYISRLGDLANKKASDMTEKEKAKAEAVKAQVLREMRKKYSERYYDTFGTNLFGGGSYTTIAKDGTKLEVAKLKARSKDNDRYVSMIKDLRTTRSRRRRR